ncbi:MAG: leucine-rich repeat protein [Bacteroidales bacterium]|nr:leucine-rich repeat protein [Bacteroidales bacterium]
MKKKLYITLALCAFAHAFAWAQKATVTASESGKINVVVTSNAANGLQSLVDGAIENYNSANGTSFAAADVESLKVGGNVVALNVDFTKGAVSSIIDLITGDNGDDASYIWSKMRGTLKKLDLSSATFNAHFAMKGSSGDTIRLNVPINVLPPKAFWRGVDIDTDLAPTACERLKYGMSALEEVVLPSSLIGFNKSTIQSLGTMLKGLISDNALAEQVVKYITEDNADAFLGIGDYAFAHATSLKSVSIPYSALTPVTGIGAKAFYNNKALTSVKFEKSNTIFSKGKTGIKTICSKAFAHSGLTEVNLPQEVDSIAEGAFQNCSKLDAVNFEGNASAVRYIGNCAFMGTAISGIEFPAKVEHIGEEALRNCVSLSRVSILGTDSLWMGEKVFYGTPAMNGGTLICNRTTPPVAIALKKKTLLGGYDGTFAGLGSSKTATAVQHGTAITNAEKPVNETDGTLTIAVPEAALTAYLAADGWTDLLAEPAPAPTPGDVNDDGMVDVSDVTALINKILGTATFTDQACDINADTKVDVSDVTALINIILAN